MLNRVLERAQTVAIGGHIRPDGDCVGSCMSLYQYLRKCYPEKQVDVYLEDIPESFKRLIAVSDQIKAEVVDVKAYDLFITLDRLSLDELSMDDIKVVADMSSLSITNSVNLIASIEKHPNAKIVFSDNATAQFILDDLVTQEFVISPNISDNSSNDYAYSSSSLQTNTVLITAPKRIIQKIGSVLACADISAEDSGYSLKKVGTLFVYDKNGEDITSDVILSLTDVLIDISMDAVKEVDLDIDVDSSISSDFKVSKVTYDTSKIKIKGIQSVLASIDSINIDLNLPVNNNTQLSEDNIRREIVTISNYLPDGISLLNDSDKEIEIAIQYGYYSRKNITFDLSDIDVLNTPSNIDVSYDTANTSYVVSVEGLSTLINDISITDLRPYLNLDGETAGGHTYSIQFSPPQDVSISNIPRVRVTLIDRNATVVNPPTHVQEPEPPVEQTPEEEPVTPSPVEPETPDSSGNVDSSEDLTDLNENLSSGGSESSADSVLGSD